MSEQENSTSSSSSPPSPEVDSSPPPPTDSSSPSNEPPPPSPPPPVGQSPPPSREQNSPSPPSNNNQNSPAPPSHKSNSGTSKIENNSNNSSPTLSSTIESLTSRNSNSNLSTNEKAIIAGVAAGAVLLIFLMIVCLVSCIRRRKRKSRDNNNNMHYYGEKAHGNKSNGYYNNGGYNAQQNNNQVMMSHGGQVSSEYWQVQPPPLPPAMMTSGQMTSANFSGPGYGPPPPPPMALGLNQSSFTYDDLASATGGFAKTNLLGQGGFGYVHKGILPNGKEVAVKSLKANSGQGEREFQAEVDIISRVHHRHLVSLVGYCIAGSQRMLVYEFVANDTLENHLHGKGKSIIDWSTRLKIALGSAKGFAYLHEDCHPRIIHRDIKASNILLDENFEAKVADFGLAKLSSDTETHVSTRIMGTFGYLAPEYAASGKLTEKSDIYSYGVVLLELITGKRPVDLDSEDDSLVEWARPIITRIIEGGGSCEEIADPLLEGRYDKQDMLRMIACASACIRQSSRKRPKMSQIVRTLEGDASLDDLNEGVKSNQSSAFGSDGSSKYDMTKYKKDGVSSEEFSSGEHGMV